MTQDNIVSKVGAVTTADQLNHEWQTKRQYYCDNCGSSFRSISELKSHQDKEV